ncbi:THC0290_0291 family protein [Gelidibacter salicanalis]|uniref:Glutamate dehydrogenase n=1 Tax=Gelidibacter salicanalis TaxID=291193 RepID=A0A934KR97_9FLAO|nr:glutamate dehydrogenase [Gelidibacter salicanalis]MBJ7882069.1 glutamate dehydrogenase [Gelidibacter salicanalis]
MALKLKQFPFLALFLIGFSAGYAQLGFSHEIGVIAGPVAFQSDFGQRYNFETNSGNTGIGIGLIHYINFSYRADCSCYTTDTYFNDHFKVRSEISWNQTKLEHFGKWVEPIRTSVWADKLRAHSGEATNFDIGSQLEYFPLSIRAFSVRVGALAPFVSLGVHLTKYYPKVATSYGDKDPTNLTNYYDPWFYPDGVRDDKFINVDPGTTLSVVGSLGMRYKLSILSDLMLDLRWQYYFRDTIDGLDHKLPSNKANDYLVWLNFGYIYYLD